MVDRTPLSWLCLLQLASATLPVGAYSYSEGLEFGVNTQWLLSAEALQGWMAEELCYGALRTEGGVMLRACHPSASGGHPSGLESVVVFCGTGHRRIPAAKLENGAIAPAAVAEVRRSVSACNGR